MVTKQQQLIFSRCPVSEHTTVQRRCCYSTFKQSSHKCAHHNSSRVKVKSSTHNLPLRPKTRVETTSALYMGGGSEPYPDHSTPPGMTRQSLQRRLGVPHGRSGRVWKNLLAPRFDPRTVQPVSARNLQTALKAIIQVDFLITQNFLIS